VSLKLDFKGFSKKRKNLKFGLLGF